ncbi:hypothetical protein DV711_17005 [Motiliproteus coralliicola]|uniref:Uncharacterized protein n=1 Tax=Motiliproteus coralliicola TaxID=2283196 RepID=A0A369WCD3_9GAMM|nr:hypothetical protein [Motiliproteus coralliicola]RDE18354.1 hypothetical protein DV711_17005 [Motiliproteus coralliicola]
MKMLYASATVGSKLKRIAPLGFDRPTEALIKLCIERQPELTLSGPEQADLLVINGDQSEAPEQLQQRYLKQYSQPGVLISRRPMEWPGFTRLEKPFSSEQFVEALQNAAQLASQSKVVEQPDLAAASGATAKGQDRRSDAYQAYCSRVAASQSALQQMQQNRKQQSQQASLLKVRLQQGLEASRRAAEDAVQQLQQQTEAEQAAPVKPTKPKPSTARRPKAESSSKAKPQAVKKSTPKTAKPRVDAPAPDPIPTDFVRPAVGGNYLELDLPVTEPKLLPEPPVVASTPVLPTASPEGIAAEPMNPVQKPMDRAMIDRCCGHSPDLNLRNPNSRRRAFFNTEGCFMTWLPKAVNKARLNQMPVQISGLPSPLIYLPEQDCFWGDFDQELLLQYCLSKFSIGELTLRSRPDLVAIEPQGKLAEPLLESRQALIWKVALWTTRGRLTEQLEPETIYTLNFKPDFRQLLMTPGAEHITELWHQQSLSATDLIHRLKLHQRFVFAFMSAANALGWLQR